jgi:hypothetical protein
MHELAGTWIPDETSRHWIKSQDDRSRCEIVLNRDGTVKATAPNCMFSGTGEGAPGVTVGAGRWSLTSKWFEVTINIQFTELDGKRCDYSATPLYVQNNDELLFWIGDPDSAERFVFGRKR